MNSKITLDWLYASGIRAIKTMAQTALGMFTIGQTIGEIKWTYILSVSIVAGIYSILTSLITTLPEVENDGVLKIDTSDPSKDTYLLGLDTPLEDLPKKRRVILTIDPHADLSNKN